MTNRDLIDQILVRANSLRLFEAGTTHVDALAVEAALLEAYQTLSQLPVQLDALTVINERMFTTTANNRVYALPEDFGMLMQPDDERQSGIFLNNGTSDNELVYRTPTEFMKDLSTTTGTPIFFTLSRDTLQLDPAPTDNSGNNFTGKGVYVERIDSLDLDRRVVVSHPDALKDRALSMLALHAESAATALLTAQSTVSLSLITTHQKRVRTKFQRTAPYSRARLRR